MTSELSGTSALVTGGAGGIGRATALALAELGARFVLSGGNAERGKKVVAQIEAAGGEGQFVAGDLRDEKSARALARETINLVIERLVAVRTPPPRAATASTSDAAAQLPHERQ